MGVRAWRDYSKPKRIEIYIRWSMYTMTVFVPLTMLPLAAEEVTRQASGFAAVLLSGLVLLGAALSVPLVRAAFECHLRGGPTPVRLLLAQAVLTQAAIWGPLLAGSRHGHRSTALLVCAEFLLVLWAVVPAIALRPRALALWGWPWWCCPCHRWPSPATAPRRRWARRSAVCSAWRDARRAAAARPGWSR